MSVAGLVAYADLDERAIDALREFNEEGALSVLQQFKESDLSHVQVSFEPKSIFFIRFSVQCKASHAHVLIVSVMPFRIRALSCVVL